MFRSEYRRKYCLAPPQIMKARSAAKHGFRVERLVTTSRRLVDRLVTTSQSSTSRRVAVSGSTQLSVDSKIESRLVTTTGSTLSESLPLSDSLSDSHESRLENHGAQCRYVFVAVFIDDLTVLY